MNSEHIKRLESILEDGFEKALFKAALQNIDDKSNPLRFNNFSYAMRELFRHVLSRLAPDSNTEKCSWYKNETGEKGKVSRGERITYAIQGGLADDYIKDLLEIDVLGTKKKIKDSVNNLSKHTHVDESTFGMSEADCYEHLENTLSSFRGLVDNISQCKSEIRDALHEQIHNQVVSEALFEAILSIDEIATHHGIEEIYVENVVVTGIDEDYIYIRAEGHIGVQLQWGSNSDLRNDIGAVLDESFSMSCELICHVRDPENFEVDLTSLGVDTSSWTEGYYNEEA